MTMLGSVMATLPLWLRLMKVSGGSVPWSAPKVGFRMALQFMSGLLQLSAMNPVLWVAAMLTAVSLVMIVVRLRREPEKLIYPYWLFGGLTILVIVASMQNHWIADRYLLIVLPPLMLILADGWVRLIQFFPKRDSIKLAVTLIVLPIPLIPFLILLNSTVGQPDQC